MKKLWVGIIFMIISVVSFSQVVNLIKTDGGVYKIACKLNGVPMNFIFDTGCNDVTISVVEAMFLVKNGLLEFDDILEKVEYRGANGEIGAATRILIRRLEIGSIVLENVIGSVIESNTALLLLGQTAFEKLGPIIVDFDKQTIEVMSFPKKIENKPKKKKFFNFKKEVELINEDY